MSVETSSPAANYLSRSNIVHPASNLPGSQGDAAVAADEAFARADLTLRKGFTVSGGSIRKGK